MELSKIREQSAKAAEQVCEAAKLKIGDLFVVGCSSSEILGEKIGTHSSVEVAEAVFEGIHSVLHEHGVELAAQCCDDLCNFLCCFNFFCKISNIYFVFV